MQSCTVARGERVDSAESSEGLRLMSATLTAPPTTISAPATRTRWGGLAGLVEVRWAAVATLLFGVGGVAQLAGAPAGVWWACYLA
jgi:cation-transporting P-type ATPase J